MKGLNKKKLTLVFLCLCSVVLAFWMAFVIVESFFFDKFFYYKSIEHGYWVPGQKLTLESFGERAFDLKQLDKDFQAIQDGDKTLETNDDDIYTIAVIGDSHVWGQGVRFKDTVSQLLEKKLNKYKNTRVLSLGYSGDSILDYYIRYNKINQVYPIDLYIFVLVDNDLMLTKDYEKKYRQTSIFNDCQDRFPEQEPVYDLSNENYEEKIISGSSISEEKWLERFEKSWHSAMNLCILDQSLLALPTDNAIFFISPYQHEEGSQLQWKTYKKYLNRNQKTVLYSTDAKTLDGYERFWEKPLKYYGVSKKDNGHPSKIAHRMFADILTKEIMNNPKWKY
jgi:hypothetical protein